MTTDPVASGERRRVDGSVVFMPSWFIQNYGSSFPDPSIAEPELLIEQAMERQRTLHQHFPDLPLGDPNPKPTPSFEWLDCGQMLHCAFGGPRPRWTPESYAWWHDRDFCPWADVERVEDVRRIQAPRWEDVPEIEGFFARLEEWKRAFPDQEIEVSCCKWEWTHPNTGQVFSMSYVPSFIDMGPILMGVERFFSTLAGDPDLGQALMAKGFELNISLSDYLRARTGTPPVQGLTQFVGDFGTFCSPRVYELYSLPFDLMVLERYGAHLPCTVHSCGPSAHLYDYWSQFPDVVFVETRGVPGELGRLRRALPKAYLQITMHPPQFEFELATPQEVRAAVWAYAEEVGLRDVDLVVMVAGYGGERVDQNVRAFYSAVDEVNAAIA